MKLMKKISVILLSLCLCMPCFSMVAHAANGRISFTDPETAVGEMVEVRCVLRSTSGNMGNIEVVLNYDSSALRFDSGSGVSDDGNGALTCTSTGGSAEVSFDMQFQALKEGDTSITISSATVADANGNALTFDQGSSAVKIAEGDPSKITEGGDSSSESAEDAAVEVNGVSYTLTDNFADTDIPSGYTRTQVSYEGAERQMVTNASGNVNLAYLTDAEGTGDFFLFDAENTSFAVYEEISISDTASIIVLNDADAVNLPDTYQEAKLTLNDKEFPVWQDTEHEGYYIIYAMNNNGEKAYYRYDSAEGTYQRFEVAQEEKTEEKKTDTSSVMGKLQNFVENHASLVVLAGGVVAILFLLILIVMAVKLRHRNAELDDLYDEYGIDMDEEPAPKKKDKKKDKKAKKKQRYEDDFEEDFLEDDFEEDMYEDEYEDEYEEAYEEDFEEAYEPEEAYEEDFEEAEYEEAYEEDFEEAFEPDFEEDVFAGYETRSEIMIDDLDALLGERTPEKRGHMETDDTFKVDFIDLD